MQRAQLPTSPRDRVRFVCHATAVLLGSILAWAELHNCRRRQLIATYTYSCLPVADQIHLKRGDKKAARAWLRKATVDSEVPESALDETARQAAAVARKKLPSCFVNASSNRAGLRG